MSLSSPENKERLELYWEHNHFSESTEKRLKKILEAGRENVPDLVFCPSPSCRTPVRTKIDHHQITLVCPQCGWAHVIHRFLSFSFVGQFTQEQKETFQRAQREDFSKLLDVMHIESGKEPSMTFQVFDTREKKQAADPLHSLSRASARFRERAVYRYWQGDADPHFPHEMTHLFAHSWAEPYVWVVELPEGANVVEREIEMVSTSFFQEGLAIAIDESRFGRMWLGSPSGEKLETWIRRNWESCSHLTISGSINFEGFNAMSDDTANAFAGSFSKYLIERFGLERYKELYIQVRETNSVLQNRQILESVLGETETVLVDHWKEWVLEVSKV